MKYKADLIVVVGWGDDERDDVEVESIPIDVCRGINSISSWESCCDLIFKYLTFSLFFHLVKKKKETVVCFIDNVYIYI